MSNWSKFFPILYQTCQLLMTACPQSRGGGTCSTSRASGRHLPASGAAQASGAWASRGAPAPSRPPDGAAPPPPINKISKINNFFETLLVMFAKFWRARSGLYRIRFLRHRGQGIDELPSICSEDLSRKLLENYSRIQSISAIHGFLNESR